MFDIWSADETHFCVQLIVLVLGLALCYSPPINPSVFQQWCCWESHADLHRRRGALKRRLRMSYQSFVRLPLMIQDDLTVNKLMANPRGGPMIPELCLFCTLRWLAGGSHLDVCDIAGLSTSSFYQVVWRTIAALCRCDQLAIVFTETNTQLQSAIMGFSHGDNLFSRWPNEARLRQLQLLCQPVPNPCRNGLGIMQAKWGILQWPIGCLQVNLEWLAQAIARLHNHICEWTFKGESNFNKQWWEWNGCEQRHQHVSFQGHRFGYCLHGYGATLQQRRSHHCWRCVS